MKNLESKILKKIKSSKMTPHQLVQYFTKINPNNEIPSEDILKKLLKNQSINVNPNWILSVSK